MRDLGVSASVCGCGCERAAPRGLNECRPAMRAERTIESNYRRGAAGRGRGRGPEAFELEVGTGIGNWESEVGSWKCRMGEPVSEPRRWRHLGRLNNRWSPQGKEGATTGGPHDTTLYMRQPTGGSGTRNFQGTATGPPMALKCRYVMANVLGWASTGCVPHGVLLLESPSYPSTF